MKVLHTLFRCGFLAVVLLLASNAVSAQNRMVRGTVTDAETGEALIGATVSVVGTTRGAQTDIDGNYGVEVPAGSTQLRIAYTGYAEQVVDLTASNVVNIALKPGTVLDEVVVIGYGSQKKRDVTGAVSSLSAENFNRGAINSPEQLVQGKLSGVQITSGNGEPGAALDIQIRGAGSIRAGNGPLYIIDGVPINQDNGNIGGTDSGFGTSAARNALNFLNPNDIETIDILKDASATAIYGARGANGVVLITTKKGSEGSTGIQYSGYYGVSNVARRIDLLDGPAFVAATDKLFGGADKNNAVLASERGNNTDWQDAIFRTAATQSHNISFSGGAKKLGYYASLGTYDQQGIIDNSRNRRYSARVNLNQKAFNDRVRFDMNLTASQTRDNGVPITNNVGFEGDLIIATLRANPTSPIYIGNDPAKGFFDPPGNSKTNPLQFLSVYDDQAKLNRVLGNLTTSIDLLPGLTFRNNLGVDNSVSERDVTLFPNTIGFSVSGRFNSGVLGLRSRVVENFLTYDVNAGEHTLQLLAGHAYQTFFSRFRQFTAIGFAGSTIDPINNPQVASDFASVKPTGNAQENEMQSFFGRAQYSFRDGRYQATATLRADGSTRFGADNRYGYFPSFALAWRLSDEPFLKDAGLFDNLKLRVGWGQTGTQEIPNKITQASFSSGANNGYWLNGTDLTNGLTYSRTPNSGLKWETGTQTNLGLDYGFMGGKISGVINWFDRRSTNTLLELQAKAASPSERVWLNLPGSIINRGLELELSLVPYRSKTFGWNVNLNATTVKNTVEDMPFSQVSTGALNGQGLTGAFSQVYRNGESVGSFLLFEHQGFDDNGINKFRDVNGDGAITEGDKVIAGKALPSFYWGVVNSFNFGNFDFNFFFQGVHGFDIYNNTANAVFSKSALSSGGNSTAEYANNTESKSNTPSASTFFLEKGDFVRLNNATLGYNFKLNNTKWVKGVRLYVTGQNLALFTDYTGYDPEVNIPKSINGVTSYGIDYSMYPRARTFLFGLNASF